MKQRYFTLVELMVVAIIVAILAAVAIPLMSGNIKRAIATEGESGLGTLRSNLRAMYAETGAYNQDPNGNAIVAGAVFGGTDGASIIPGLSAGDLDGKYFSDGAYFIDSVDDTSYVLSARGAVAGNDAPSEDQAEEVWIKLNEEGQFVRDFNGNEPAFGTP